MRNNQPVTQREYRIPEHYRLISSTDKRGVIQHCNQEFIEVSGFTREELIGENHNLVRHPDMPPAVFKEMWKTLAAGKIWMGLVKNRRKNGDHYWVSAFVTPIFDAGKIMGYESVRIPATASEIKRAELRYQRLRQGKPSITRLELLSHYSLGSFPTLLTGAVTTAAVAVMGNFSLAAVTLLGFSLNAWWCQRQQREAWQQLMALSPDSYRNVMVAQTYFNDYGVRAQAKLVLACELARSRTALMRIDDASKGLDDIAKRTYEQAQTTNTAFIAHNQATQQIASAIKQMSHAIQEVAERVEANALSAQTAAENVATGNHKAEQSLQAIIELRQAVESISSTVQELAQSTNDIGEAASIISTIADQTNLLALNAAIEAARAGEQGRGFAVVADEVRSLASKTRQSTDKIHHIIQALAERSTRAVKVSEAGVESAQRGAEIVEETRIALNQINQAVSGITDMTVAMSAAVEEQSTVAEHIDKQINEVAEGAEDMAKAAAVALEANAALTQTVENVHSVITRFSTNK